MSLAELEKERGYVVGAAGRVREKIGLPAVSVADAVKNIEARIKFEASVKKPPGDSTVKFNFIPMPPKGAK